MSTPMSAERIAELRRSHGGTIVGRETLDEIERLRGLIGGAHRLTYYDYLGCAYCSCGRRLGTHPGPRLRSLNEADRLHAAHIDELVPGWRP